MARGQKRGWKLLANIPKTLPEKPVKVDTGIWLQPSGTFAAYLYRRDDAIFLGCFPTLHQAIDAREQKRHELKTGRAIVRRSATAATLPTFVEKVYFPETLALVKDSTARTNRSRYNRHVVPFFKDIALRDIDYDRCSQFRAAMLAKAVSGQTRREAVRLLRSILDDASRRGLLPANPAALLRLPPKGGEPISVPVYDDAVKLVAAIAHPVARMAASLLLKTGMRLNEALSLEWKNIDLAGRKIFVAHSIDQVTGKLVTPKTKTAVRLVDIPWDLAEELKSYRAAQEAGEVTRHDPWVFPSETTRTEGSPAVLNDRNFVQRWWEPALTTAGVERFTPHALRHLYASRCLQTGGLPVAYVSQQLGHSSPAFTYKQYARFLSSAGETGQDYLARVFGAPPPDAGSGTGVIVTRSTEPSGP